jgi:hypothetical protein
VEYLALFHRPDQFQSHSQAADIDALPLIIALLLLSGEKTDNAVQLLVHVIEKIKKGGVRDAETLSLIPRERFCHVGSRMKKELLAVTLFLSAVLF